MRLSYKLRVFLMLSLGLVVFAAAWSVWRYASHAEEREAWEETVERLEAQKTRIDSLSTAIAEMDLDLEEEKERLAAASERIGHYERRADGGRLPTPQFQRYEASIERHNEIVERHNERLARLQEIYEEYAALVDRHNALIDTANAMQRRAVEEGYQLPAAELLLR
ncbi:MAG: hypothetical protein R3326_06835 [Gemmatimonadota bacterium]|nr:hypothetical protein [Gemmatimonadota bacterium]